MKTKDKIFTIIFCAIISCFYIVTNSYQKLNKQPHKVYNIYLDGKIIGAIEDKDALYALIDEKQQVIKERYNVQNVYPPNSLEIIENYSYTTDYMDLNTIYNKIENIQDFTILGYEVKIGSNDNHDEYTLYTLDKNIFNEAVKDFILAFIDEEGYNNYLNGNQESLEGVGITYQDMQILEDIVIKRKNISVNEKIYENSTDLAQDLLFGFNYKKKNYTVKLGDTIESVAEDNTLNTQEFLIANPEYSSKDSLLAVGDTVNITLIAPVISFSYLVDEVLEVEEPFENKIERDNNQPSSYSEITTPGVTGIYLQEKKYTVVNGEPNNDVDVQIIDTIREKVNQVTTKGKKGSIIWGNEYAPDFGSGWKWPTNSPYAITSPFGYRWGKTHQGIDISGTGEGSNIYAANDGVVIKVVTSCPDNGSYPNSCGGGYGNQVIIDHGNNIYTTYAHMTHKVRVSVGETVSRGQVIGYMGNSGQSKGVHLHFGYSVGSPSGNYKNPMVLFPW